MIDGILNTLFLLAFLCFSFVANPGMQVLSAWITESAYCFCDGSCTMINSQDFCSLLLRKHGHDRDF